MVLCGMHLKMVSWKKANMSGGYEWKRGLSTGLGQTHLGRILCPDGIVASESLLLIGRRPLEGQGPSLWSRHHKSTSCSQEVGFDGAQKLKGRICNLLGSVSHLFGAGVPVCVRSGVQLVAVHSEYPFPFDGNFWTLLPRLDLLY